MIKKLLLTLFFLATGYLLLHNITIYNPKNGFDGQGHVSYINYILQNKKLPLPHEGWQLNQPPIFYLLAAPLQASHLKPQVINFLSFFIILFLLFRFTKSYIAVLGFSSLPVAIYLVPLITNEYLSGLFGIVILLVLLKISTSGEKGNHLYTLLVIFFSLGFYTKVTNLMFLPLIPLALFLQKNKKWISRSAVIVSICLAMASPLMINNILRYGKPLVINDDFVEFDREKAQSREISFFLDPSWIFHPDLYTAHDYSFAGGMWNTFWHDGEHVATPEDTSDKRPLSLWLLGFPLAALSIFGLVRFIKKHKQQGIILISYLVLSLAVLILYNFRLPFHNVLKAFFVFPVVVPYVLGLVEASKYKKLSFAVTLLLMVQYITMCTWLYIQHWWYVAQ